MLIKKLKKNLGMKISKIFEIKGEDYFRKIEENITLKILKNSNSSIITWSGELF